MIEIYVDIHQTQQDLLDVVAEQRPVIFNRSYITGNAKARWDDPRQKPCIVKTNKEDVQNASLNYRSFTDGEVYIQQSRGGKRCWIFIAYNIAGPGQDPIMQWVPFGGAKAGEINPETGTAWRHREGNQIGEAI